MISTPSNGYQEEMGEIPFELEYSTSDTGEYTLTDIHHDMVLCNQLLGVIIALLIFHFSLDILNFFIRLITKNITNIL